VTTGAAPRPAHLVESVDRAMQVLDLLASRPELTSTEVSRRLGVAPSTAHRLLSTMAHRAMVQQDPETRAWRAGGALVELGVSVAGLRDARRMSRPVLEALAAELLETVHLARLDGDQVLFLDTVESTRAARVTDRTGVSLPAHCTASGKVLLARLGSEALDRLLPDPLPALTPRTRTSRPGLERELAAVRRTGHAVNMGESERGLSAVAVAIPCPAGCAALSLTVSVPSEHLRRDEVDRLARAARAAAAQLGRRLQG
jgi:IclR family acetate operon transcriptional repressor